MMQVPPAHSAVKVGGTPAYRLARQGKPVELKPRSVVIHEFEITSINLPEIGFKVTCSKGTYIRSLVRDFGAYLKVGAYLSALRRTRIGDFKVEDAKAVDAIE
jgi:tRNA pseudouridine55 synthase